MILHMCNSDASRQCPPYYGKIITTNQYFDFVLFLSSKFNGQSTGEWSYKLSFGVYGTNGKTHFDFAIRNIVPAMAHLR